MCFSIENYTVSLSGQLQQKYYRLDALSNKHYSSGGWGDESAGIFGIW